MKSSNEEPLVLSKNNARNFLVRNAIDAATLEKEARLLQTERKSEERIFRKKRELILQRQSRIFESQRSLLSSPASLPDTQLNHSSSKEKFSSLRRSHSMNLLPDIHATQRKTERNSKKHSDTDVRRWQVFNKDKTGEGFSTETCAIEDWTELRKCRYLRTCSTKKELLDVEKTRFSGDRFSMTTSRGLTENPVRRNEEGRAK